MKEALAMQRRALPEGHPRIATSLGNLAGLYQAQGRLKEAGPLYEEALAMKRRALPEGHPDIATSLNNLATLHATRKQFSRALPLMREAVDMFGKAASPHLQNAERNLEHCERELARLGRNTFAERQGRRECEQKCKQREAQARVQAAPEAAAAALGRLPGGVRRRGQQVQHGARPVARYPERPQVVPQPRREHAAA